MWNDERLREHVLGSASFRALIQGVALAEKGHFFVLVVETPRLAALCLEMIREGVAALRERPVRLERFALTELDELESAELFHALVKSIMVPLAEWAAGEQYEMNTSEDSILFAIDASGALSDEQIAWERLFQRLNEMRNELLQGLSNSLILIIPSFLSNSFCYLARDLWSVKSILVRLSLPPKDLNFSSFFDELKDVKTGYDLAKLDSSKLKATIQRGRKLNWAKTSDDEKRTFLLSLVQLAEFEIGYGNIINALNLYNESLHFISIAICQYPANYPSKMFWEYQRLFILDMISRIELIKNNPLKSIDLYRNCLSILVGLRRGEPSNTELTFVYSIFLTRSADVLLLVQGLEEEAYDNYIESMNIQLKLLEILSGKMKISDNSDNIEYSNNIKNTELYNALSLTYEGIGNCRFEQGQLDQSLEAYEESLAVKRSLLTFDPNRAEWRRNLSMSLDKIGNIQSARGHLEKALEAYEESLAVRRSLLAFDPNRASFHYDIGVSYYKLFQTAKTAGDRDAARDWILKARAEFEPLADQYPDMTDWKNAAEICRQEWAALETSAAEETP